MLAAVVVSCTSPRRTTFNLGSVLSSRVTVSSCRPDKRRNASGPTQDLQHEIGRGVIAPLHRCCADFGERHASFFYVLPADRCILQQLTLAILDPPLEMFGPPIDALQNRRGRQKLERAAHSEPLATAMLKPPAQSRCRAPQPRAAHRRASRAQRSDPARSPHPYPRPQPAPTCAPLAPLPAIPPASPRPIAAATPVPLPHTTAAAPNNSPRLLIRDFISFPYNFTAAADRTAGAWHGSAAIRANYGSVTQRTT